MEIKVIQNLRGRLRHPNLARRIYRPLTPEPIGLALRNR